MLKVEKEKIKAQAEKMVEKGTKELKKMVEKQAKKVAKVDTSFKIKSSRIKRKQTELQIENEVAKELEKKQAETAITGQGQAPAKKTRGRPKKAAVAEPSVPTPQVVAIPTPQVVVTPTPQAVVPPAPQQTEVAK